MRTLALVLILTAALPISGQDQPNYDEEIKVLAFKEMTYPYWARAARMEGAVVVRATLDEQGKVKEAVAISGKQVLVSDTLKNIKDWRFGPTKNNTVVVVYRFSIVEGECASLDHMFVFQRPNIANLIACPVPVNP